MNKHSLDSLRLLLEWLHDPAVHAELKDDAAMDLGDYDDPEAEQSLLQVAADSQADPIVIASCGESLAEIWHRQGRVPSPELFAGLHEAARAKIKTHKNRDKQRN